MRQTHEVRGAAGPHTPTAVPLLERLLCFALALPAIALAAYWVYGAVVTAVPSWSDSPRIRGPSTEGRVFSEVCVISAAALLGFAGGGLIRRAFGRSAPLTVLVGTYLMGILMSGVAFVVLLANFSND